MAAADDGAQSRQREAAPSLLCVDAQSAKLTPRIFRERGIDGGKHVNGRKRQIAVDNRGRIWCAHVTAADVADARGGPRKRGLLRFARNDNSVCLLLPQCLNSAGSTESVFVS